MTEKTVKVTNGKVLNYTITADGYKTVHGSKIITENTEIKQNMVASSSSDPEYKMGDRINNCATFVCYFNSINPDNQVAQKYAVFVVDAKYRGNGVFFTDSNSNPGLPTYSTTAQALAAKESATWNTSTVIGKQPLSKLPAFALCRQLNIFIDDKIYQGQLPNYYEEVQIYNNRYILDTFDPTIEDYPTESLATKFASSTYSSTKKSGD